MRTTASRGLQVERSNEGPVPGVGAGPSCSCWRSGGHRVVMITSRYSAVTSVTAARVAAWSRWSCSLRMSRRGLAARGCFTARGRPLLWHGLLVPTVSLGVLDPFTVSVSPWREQIGQQVGAGVGARPAGVRGRRAAVVPA